MFITPTKVQLDILSKILDKDQLDSVISRGLSDSLVLIGILQKICNSPILLKATADKNKTKENGGGEVTRSVLQEALEYLPRKIQVEDVSLSGEFLDLIGANNKTDAVSTRKIDGFSQSSPNDQEGG